MEKTDLRLRWNSTAVPCVLLLAFTLCGTASAQLLTVDAGQGMLGEPSGGTVAADFGNWTMEASLGLYNGTVVGGADGKVQFNRQWNLKAGDQSIHVGIPTDTNFSTELIARGASLVYAPSEATQVTVFGGMAGSGYTSPSVFFFDPQIPLGSLSIDHYLDSKKSLLVFARALFSNQQTILGGAVYHTKRLQTGFAVGIGSNQPHVEGLLDYKDNRWEIHSGYRYSGNRFQLLTLPQFKYAQEDRENADVRWSPATQATLTFARHRYLEPATGATLNGNATRGSMDMAGGMFSVHGFGFGANALESRFTGIYASAASFFASQRLTNATHLSGNYYWPLHSSRPMPMLSFNMDENLNRRLKLAQFITHTNQQWSVNYGGTLRWDRFEVNVGYVTNFAPLATGGGRFVQQMNVSGHFTFSRWQFGVQTYAQPDGRVLYGYEVKSFYFRPTANGSVQAPQSRGAAAFLSFLIEGQVRLEGTDAPVANVPIRIGDDTVFTDDAGTYSLRVARKHLYKILVKLDRQIDSHYYEKVSGPEEVIAGTDEAPGRAQFVLRVNQAKIPSLRKPGGIVIGQTGPAPDGTTGSMQGDNTGGSGSGGGGESKMDSDGQTQTDLNLQPAGQ